MDAVSSKDNAMSPENYASFRALLAKESGLVLGANKQYLVVSRLLPLVREAGFDSVDGLLDAVPGNARLRRRAINAMMTHETFWFRDAVPFNILAERVLPELARRCRRPLRIWSAACSFGQEPYSIAITIEETLRRQPGLIAGAEILGTDISPAALTRAAAGIYNELAAARGLSPALRESYFRPGAEGWIVRSAVRRHVRFQPHNLLDSYALLGRFDIIFCRNVLIYFAEATKRDIVARLREALNPGGYLFLGASESLIYYSNAFETVRCQPGVVYRRCDG